MFISVISAEGDSQMWVNSDHIVAVRQPGSAGPNQCVLECVAFKEGPSSIKLNMSVGRVISLIEQANLRSQRAARRRTAI
ncbi:hypothetical protein E0H56_27730 [Rhizobium leguminosarum bv. viciae]|uniref:hypothetical protein n=1 Tax=Rhizobium leguminosarum TaxID=384 RepID=UPI001038D5D6|nr:hypothetical protein [Rhizobium leguminosarum]MBY5530527.1 hypothetical protein [Rhizobium leguminosarum]TBZ86143.1 hypothetical protein E0H56_27730 [Rhizobium leguminosarum bv. viciae]